MWVMTTRGFYSAVQHREQPTKLLIRARCKEDIDNLRDLLPNSEPWRLRSSDYEWRLECTVAEWAGALANMALDIDYGNFKTAVKNEQGQRRANIYMRCWSALLAIERPGRFGWSGSQSKLPVGGGSKASKKPSKGGGKKRRR